MTVNHILYLTISIAVTVGVARTLHKHGRPFLVDVFDGNGRLADAVNQLLVVGFYLLNFGLVAVALRLDGVASTPLDSIELLATKVGRVLLVLGVMHLFNVAVLTAVRRRQLARPIEITEFLNE